MQEIRERGRTYGAHSSLFGGDRTTGLFQMVITSKMRTCFRTELGYDLTGHGKARALQMLK